MMTGMKSISSSSSKNIEFTLARLSDAHQIGAMSRDLIESGLSWSWKPARVARQIRSPDVVVLVARDRNQLVGFSIMEFFADQAHLYLLGIKPSHQRIGIGRRLLRWLEESALTAGTPIIYLEVRAGNRVARRFYCSLGYREIARFPRYYQDHESAVRMARDLWSGSAKQSKA